LRIVAHLVGLAVGGLGWLWWAGFLSSDTRSYDLPAADVQARLEHVGLPPMVFGERTPDASVQSEPGRVSWVVSEQGAEVMRYVIDVTPTDARHTRVHVGLTGSTQGKFGNVERLIRSDRTLKNLYVTAMKEQVDSVLTDRPFRYSAISGATTAATLVHMGQIAHWMDDAAEAHEKVERANMDKAYRDAGLD
jgi:hypothetical protein